jgi:hypothetical protein
VDRIGHTETLVRARAHGACQCQPHARPSRSVLHVGNRRALREKSSARRGQARRHHAPVEQRQQKPLGSRGSSTEAVGNRLERPRERGLLCVRAYSGKAWAPSLAEPARAAWLALREFPRGSLRLIGPRRQGHAGATDRGFDDPPRLSPALTGGAFSRQVEAVVLVPIRLQ